MHIYAGSPFLLWSVRYASSVCCCSAYSIVIFYGHSSSPYSIIVVTRHFVCTTPPRGGPRFVRQDNFAPSRRFREDGLEALKLSSGGGAPEHKFTLVAPAVAKQTNPINSDSAGPSGAHGTYTLKKTKRFRFWSPCGKLNNMPWAQHFFT